MWILFFLIEEGFALAQRTKGKLVRSHFLLMLLHPYWAGVKWAGIICTLITGQRASFLNSAGPFVPFHPRLLVPFLAPILQTPSSPSNHSPPLIPRLNNPSVFLALLAAFLISDSPSDYGGQNPNQNDCGTWVRNINGGVFTSPNYPNTYPPNKECVYILEGKGRSPLLQSGWHSFLPLGALPPSLNVISLTDIVLYNLVPIWFSAPSLAGNQPDIFPNEPSAVCLSAQIRPFEDDGEWRIVGSSWLLA